MNPDERQWHLDQQWSDARDIEEGAHTCTGCGEYVHERRYLDEDQRCERCGPLDDKASLLSASLRDPGTEYLTDEEEEALERRRYDEERAIEEMERGRR